MCRREIDGAANMIDCNEIEPKRVAMVDAEKRSEQKRGRDPSQSEKEGQGPPRGLVLAP